MVHFYWSPLLLCFYQFNYLQILLLLLFQFPKLLIFVIISHFTHPPQAQVTKCFILPLFKVNLPKFHNRLKPVSYPLIFNCPLAGKAFKISVNREQGQFSISISQDKVQIKMPNLDTKGVFLKIYFWCKFPGRKKIRFALKIEPLNFCCLTFPETLI